MDKICRSVFKKKAFRQLSKPEKRTHALRHLLSSRCNRVQRSNQFYYCKSVVLLGAALNPLKNYVSENDLGLKNYF